MTARQDGEILTRDTLLLSSARRRQNFAGKLNGDAKAIETDLLRIEDALRAELARRQQAKDAESSADGMDDPELWQDLVDGDVLLHDLLKAIRRFVVLPKHADLAVTLWVVATHALDAWDVFPLLAITSPTKRCGKTTCLDVLSFLLPRPLLASNISPASVYRAIEAWHPCLLVDEADTFLPNNDELRGVVNSSHNRAAAFVLRVEGEGEDRQVVPFSTWCPKVVAGIGSLPATLEDRSIIVRLRRKTKADPVERARHRTLGGLRDLRRQAARWVVDNLGDLELADPTTPDELDDRAADNWLPLLAVADLAGGQWPELARKAAITLSADRDAADDEDAIRLLRNVKAVFEVKGVDRIASAELVAALIAEEEWGWSAWRKGRSLDQWGLSRLLAPFKIKPRTIRIAAGTAKGYMREWFTDAWCRYLVSDPSHPSQVNNDAGLGPFFDPSQRESVTDEKTHVTIEKQKNVTGVTDKNGVGGAMQQEAELF